MKKRVLAYGRLNEAQLAQLAEQFEVQTFRDLASADDPDFRAALPGAHGLIGASLTVTPELLDAAPKLEAIATISVGYDNYPVDELTRRGILLCNTPDVLTETTADTGFLLVMADLALAQLEKLPASPYRDSMADLARLAVERKA